MGTPPLSALWTSRPICSSCLKLTWTFTVFWSISPSAAGLSPVHQANQVWVHLLCVFLVDTSSCSAVSWASSTSLFGVALRACGAGSRGVQPLGHCRARAESQGSESRQPRTGTLHEGSCLLVGLRKKASVLTTSISRSDYLGWGESCPGRVSLLIVEAVSTTS